MANNAGENCNDPLNSLGYNLTDGAASACSLTDPTDQIETDPQLELLADNGGPTLTHALLPGSPALDAGSNKRAKVKRSSGRGCEAPA